MMQNNLQNNGVNLSSNRKHGVLITFEGGECSGKDTQIELLEERLSSLNLKVNSNFWEPGSTLNSEIIRILLKNKHNSNYEFPDNFIETFDLGMYTRDFKNEVIPFTATNYLQEALHKMQNGIKKEIVHFLLYHNFHHDGDLWPTINTLNRERNSEEFAGGTPAEWLFKEYLSNEKLTPEVQMYLFFAARNILHHNEINKALYENDAVVINRSKDSTAVYQGYAQDPSLIAKIRAENVEATEYIFPNVTILIDLPVDEVAARKLKRDSEEKHQGLAKDFFDNQELSFHLRVRGGYLSEAAHYASLPKDHPEYGRIKIINGVGTPEQVHKRIFEEVIKYFK
jgi:thymidylate kinase